MRMPKLAKSRLPHLLAFLFICGLCFVVRAIGNDWGFVRAETYRSLGAELPDDIPDSRILGYYVHDEHSFVRFLDYSHQVRLIVGEARSGELPLHQVPGRLYRSAVVDGVMAPTPFSSMVFSLWGTAVTLVRQGLGIEPSGWYFLVTTTYRAGRDLTAFFAVLGLFPFTWLLRRLEIDGRRRLVALLLYALQPVSVATSHWMGYNSLSVTLHLIAFILLLKAFDRQKESARLRLGVWLGVGAWLGLCLANKWTVLPLFPVAAGAVVCALLYGPRLGDHPWRRHLTAQLLPIVACGAALIVGIVAVYVFFIGPNLLAGETVGFVEQRHNVVDRSLDESGGRLARLWSYGTETLPVAFGWYPLLLGIAGAVLWCRRRPSVEQGLVLLWLGTLIVAFTSNSLGLMPGRNLGVGALWLLPAVAALQALARTRPRLADALAVLCVLSSLVSTVLLERYFLQETDGYRTRASAYLMRHAAPGSPVYLEDDIKYFHTDLSLAARKLEPEFHAFEFRFRAPEALTAQDEGFALYRPGALPAAASGAEPVASFRPCCLPVDQESTFQTWLRRAAGQPALDGLIFRAPGLEAYRLPGPPVDEAVFIQNERGSG